MRNCAIIVPRIGKDNYNYIWKEKFYWFPFYQEGEPYSFKELFYPTKNKMYYNKEIINELSYRKLINKEFHFDPYLNGEYSSYAEPDPEGNKRKKGAKILKFLNAQVDQNEEEIFVKKSDVTAMLYFGAKFQKYEDLGLNDKNTKLYLIGELNIKYAGLKSDLLDNRIPIKRYMRYNAHERRGDDDYILFAGRGRFFSNPSKPFAKWNPQTSSYKLLMKEYKNQYETGSILTSVHLGLFEKNVVKDFIRK